MRTIAKSSASSCLAPVMPASAAAAPAPAWSLSLTPMPSNFAPVCGPEYPVAATNVGGGLDSVAKGGEL